MSDGAKFQATSPNGSTLSAAPPAAFGFLNANPAKISVNGSTLGPVAGTLGLVGGPVSISGASLSAPAGTIHVASAAGNGEVPVDPRNNQALTVSSFGPVDIRGGSIINAGDRVNRRSGGSVFVRSGTLKIDASTVVANNFGSGPGGLVFLRGDYQVALTGGTVVQAAALGTGSGGAVTISTAPSGSISADNSDVLTGSIGPGQGGPLSLKTGQLKLTNGTEVGSLISGDGNAQPVTLKADSVLIDGRANQHLETGIGSRTGDPNTGANGTGTGAEVKVNVGPGGLMILGNGLIASTTFGQGNAGSTSINVVGAMSIDATSAVSPTGVTAVANPGSTGKAGAVVVDARSLSVTNGAQISASAGGSGAGGDVTVQVAGNLVITGGTTSLNPAGISAVTLDPSGGNGGRIAIAAENISVLNGGVISTSTFGGGAAGEVSVNAASRLVIGGAGSVIASSANSGSTGNAGRVTVMANSLTVQGGAQIASSTAGPGSGGPVAVKVASDIVLPDPGPQITAQSTGSGDAGSITVSAVRLLMSNGAAISTQASTADGGNVTLNVSDLVYLLSSKITASVNTESGNGGNITIDPQLVVLNHSSIKATAAEGRGGNIRINAGAFIASADSTVDASSQKGISGTVVITGPRVDVNGALVVLSSELRGHAAVLREACTARADRPVSSLVEAGRGGLPQDPEATLPALYIADRDFQPNAQSGAGTIPAGGAPLRTTLRLTMPCG
jgi:hypothetical protein